MVKGLAPPPVPEPEACRTSCRGPGDGGGGGSRLKFPGAEGLGGGAQQRGQGTQGARVIPARAPCSRGTQGPGFQPRGR